MCSLRFKVMTSIFNNFQKASYLICVVYRDTCTPREARMAEDGYCRGQGMLRCNTSWMVDEGWQAATMTMEDEAQRATMHLLGGGGS